MNLKELSVSVATKAHAGQKDRGGHDYIEHPLRVASTFSDDIPYAVAVLHDVVEDTAVTLNDLVAQGFPDEVVSAVDALTRRSCEDYEKYIQRLSNNPLAKSVKLEDLRHNMDLKRIPYPTAKDLQHMERYKAAYEYLSK